LGREICFSYNEDTFTIYDMSQHDKTGINGSTVISKLSYTGASYVHQGWFIDPNWHTHILLDDEYDEYDLVIADGHPVTYIIDVTNLEDPKQSGIWKSEHYGIDHNQYVWDGLDYQSMYGIGLTVLDVSGVVDDPTGGNIEEIAWFDIYPEDDHEENGGVIDFVGSWSHYAGLPSGNIVINTIERGVFVARISSFGESRARGKRHAAPRRIR
jgi:choice-of-anchor B domain-containing protein